MRIIGGAQGGRRLVAPAGTSTRPSAARVREGLASALEARGLVRDAHVLDLFAGSGALGLEALSRGARNLVAVDSSPHAARCIAQNAEALGLTSRVRVMRLDVLAQPARAASRLADLEAAPFSLAFVDAPYARLAAIPALLERLVDDTTLGMGGVVAVEHSAGSTPAWPTHLVPLAHYRYGDTGITLLEVASKGPA